jgi:ABC-type transport system involved in cytochrome c biogenesis permease component
MTVLPVIARELRASARQPFTYYLRVVGVTALLVASLLFGLHFGFEPALGRPLFGALHGTLFGAIWLLVPMLTADCISRERREGTLGLLFLTPLTGTDIVVAKGLVHGLRAMTFWLAVLPVLTVPFLIGGVSWREAALSVLVNANAMCWALSAGLLASAWNKEWLRALLGAALLSCTLQIGRAHV